MVSSKRIATLIALCLCSTLAPAQQPDLFRFQPSARPLTGSGSVDGQRIEIRTQPIARAAPRLRFPLFDGLHEAVLSKHEYRGPDDASWFGELDSKNKGRVVLTHRSGHIAGRIEGDDALYIIEPDAGGGHGLKRIDERVFPVCPGAVAPAAKAVSPRGARPLADGPDRIDLLVLYTPQARDGAGGVAQILAVIQNAIDVGNDAFANSGMVARFNLVGTALANHDDAASQTQDLAWLSSDTGVAALREQFAADVVSLFTNIFTDSCGIAFQMNSPGAGFASMAFQVSARNCAVSNMTFAHESGHLMGFEHNPLNAGNTPATASFPWSFAHFVDGAFRTVMALPNQCAIGCMRRAYFSNPQVPVLGFPSGLADERDNHRTGESTAVILANFRDGSSNAPDLITVVTSADTRNLRPGDSVLVFYDIINQGPGSLPGGYREALYLSENNVYDASDVLVGSSVEHTLTLASGASLAAATTANLPLGETGSRILILVADSDNAVGESDEANNTTSLAIRILGPDELFVDGFESLPL